MNGNTSRRGRLLRNALLAIVCLWVVGGLTIGALVWNNNRNQARSLDLGELAPAFSLQDQYGHAHKLEDYKKRPVAVAFLPDLQETSVAQLRSMNSAIQQFDTLGVKVFAVTKADAATAKRVHDAEGLNFPILLDNERKTAHDYGAEASDEPAQRLSYVIGVDGRVLLPVTVVHATTHGQQLVELAECCLDEKPQAPSRLVGKPIPDFKLPRVADSQPETLYGDKKQRLTVLFVMSATCPCSGGYDARMAELARQYGTQGVRFIAINASANETAKEVAAHASKAGYTFPVLKDADNVIADRIEAKVTPEAFVMDAKGVLRYHGRIDDSRKADEVKAHDLRNALDFMLAGKLPPRADLPTFGCAIYRASKGST